MPSPSASLATLRPDLAESFTQYDLAAAAMGFIGTKVLTPVDVPTQAGNFGIIPLEQLLQSSDTARAPGASYSRASYTFKSSTFACKENGHEEVVDDRERNMYANYFSAEQVAALRARDVVLRNKEKRDATLLTSATYFNTTNGNTGSVTTSWKTVGTSVPVTDVTAAKKVVYAKSGLIANTVVIGWNAYLNLQQTTTIIDRIKYSGLQSPNTDMITTLLLAQLFDVKRVLVAGAQYNSANQGQSATLTQVWDDGYVGVYACAEGPDFKAPCIGRTFVWSADGSSLNGTVESYRDETRRGDVIRVRQDTDEQILYPQAGYLLSGANA